MKHLRELRFYSFLFYCFALQAQEGGSADLLGLGVPSAAGTNGAVNGAATVTNNIAKFHCKSNGVLYENEILQVIAKRSAFELPLLNALPINRLA